MIRKIICIGLDGATWDLLRPRMEAGQLPHLQRLAAAGATGDLTSIFPPETPAAWPSFMTGKNPGKHGVFDFLVYNPETKSETPVNARLRVGKTIWDYLNDAGKTSLILNVPTTYPPVPIRGALISDFLTPGDARDYAHPKELVEELEAEFGRYPLFFETMQFAAGVSARNARKFLDELEWMDRVKFDVAVKLFDRYEPDFTMLHIWGTDRLQHEVWHFFDKAHPKYNPAMAREFGPRIEAYYQMLDTRIGQFADKLGAEDLSFVISDHGFGPTHHFIDLNSWLLREGFIQLKDTWRVRLKKILWNLNITPVSLTRKLVPLLRLAALFKAPDPASFLRKSTGALHIPGMLDLRHDVDWERTRAYAPFGWSGIHVNTRGIRPHGSVPPEETQAVRDEIVRRWAELRNPKTGEPVGGPVHTNAEMFHGPYAKYGPDVMPLPLDANYMPVCFFGFESKEPVYENYTLFGNHRMDGILLAHGQGIQPGTVTGAQLIDLAPTFLHLLGQPVPDDMDGRVLEDLFTEDERRAHPITTAHASGEGAQGDRLTEEEEAELRERLMGLGYL